MKPVTVYTDVYFGASHRYNRFQLHEWTDGYFINDSKVLVTTHYPRSAHTSLTLHPHALVIAHELCLVSA